MSYRKKNFHLLMSCGHTASHEFTMSPGYEERIEKYKAKECMECYNAKLSILYDEQLKQGWPELEASQLNNKLYAAKIRQAFSDDVIKEVFAVRVTLLPAETCDEFLQYIADEYRRIPIANVWIAKEKDKELDARKLLNRWLKANKKPLLPTNGPIKVKETNIKEVLAEQIEEKPIVVKLISQQSVTIHDSKQHRLLLTVERDLNKIEIFGRSDNIKQSDFSTCVSHSDKQSDYLSVSAVFRDIEKHLVGTINSLSPSSVIVGCVAWFTNENVADALSKYDCSLLVQKEDFLRPADKQDNFKAKLTSTYDKLKCDIDCIDLVGVAMNHDNLVTKVEPVRCVGHCDRESISSRMHHKFLVFCERQTQYSPKRFKDVTTLKPWMVWTGSYNVTESANNSFENVVKVENNAIAEAYFNEYRQLFMLSEPLDWNSKYCEPQYSIV